MFDLAYNHITLWKPAISFLAVMLAGRVFLAASEQESAAKPPVQMLLIMPFENVSGAAGIDWISEAFPEVLGSRLRSSLIFVITREDRLSALDQLGIPGSAKPSRATIYQIGETLDADYVVTGKYSVEGKVLTIRARVMNLARLRLTPEITESGPLNDLIAIQTRLAWDIATSIHLIHLPDRSQFLSQFAPVRLDALENYIRGIVATNTGERIGRFKQAVQLEPGNVRAILQLGKAFYDAHDYASAITWLTQVPDSDPSANEARFYLGMASFYAGHLDQAVDAFLELASRLPLTEVYNNLGVVAARQANQEARSYFEKAVAADPSDPDYHFNLGIELYREGDAPAAIRQLQDTVKLHPDDEARTFLNSLNAGVKPNRVPMERIKLNYEESSFRQVAMEINNADEARLKTVDSVGHAAFHVRRGQHLLQRGLTGEAEKQFREAIVLDPTSADAHTGLARVLELTNNPVGARSEARMSLGLKPNAGAYIVLTRLDLAAGNSSSAQRNLEQALFLDPSNPAAVELKHEIVTSSPAPSTQQP